MSPTELLVVASLALLVGPLLDAFGGRFRGARHLIDGFALVAVGGLCFIAILPHVVREIGVQAWGFAAMGALLPAIGHRLQEGHRWSIGLGTLALLAHAALDGAVLGGPDVPLSWAVAAHRLPVGFAIVIAVQTAQRPRRLAWGITLAMALTTVAGFLAGPWIWAWLPATSASGLEAFVAGLLLHVVFVPNAVRARRHQHHQHHQNAVPQVPGWPQHPWATAGALGGLAAVAWASTIEGHHSLTPQMRTFVETLGVLFLESAPALLLGYGLAGLVPLLVTPATMGSLSSKTRLEQSLRGVAFGLPLPVCSCGVLPLYETLIRRGAPPAAAMAFFVSTPELGLDAVLLSVPLLGPSLTAARVVSAFFVALVVALLVGARPTTTSPPNSDLWDERSKPWSARVLAGLRFGFVEVFDHTMPWIALGLFVAAWVEPMLARGAIAQIPSVLQAPLAALVGVPVYVCASGATPVAALALHKGLSAGAALAFLIAGPATNVTTFGVLARLHGRRTAALFGLCVTALAVLAGWTVDLLGVAAVPVLDVEAGSHEPHASWIAWLCAGSLIVLCALSLLRQGPRGALRQILEPIHAH